MDYAPIACSPALEVVMNTSQDRIAFEGRAVIVTGAGNGLGRSHALELARRGARLIVNDLGGEMDGSGSSTKVADRVVEEIRARNGEAVANYDSVATSAGGRRIVETCLDAFGRLDAVINNAGNLRYAPFDELGDDDVAALIDTHLVGAFNVSRPAFRRMRGSGYGRFVFTSSGAGFFGNSNQAHYMAAKAGLLGLNHAVAIEGASLGIRSNCVLPMAHTRMAEVPEANGIEPRDAERAAGAAKFQDLMRPEFVTPLVVYLASEACTVTQQVFSAGYGRYARVLIGVAPGWHGPRAMPAKAEDVRDRLAEISDCSHFFIPTSVFDEVGHVIESAQKLR